MVGGLGVFTTSNFCFTFQCKMIDLTSSPVKTAPQSLEVVKQSASDKYSNITDSDSDEEVKTKSKGDFYFQQREKIDLTSSPVKTDISGSHSSEIVMQSASDICIPI